MENIDYKNLFESLPGAYLILTPELKIVTANDAYLNATMTKRDQVKGRHLFDVFPDNPNDKEATGTANLRASLNRVLKNKKPDTMAVQKYDIRKPESEGGEFEVRYWSPINSPILNAAGQVELIAHKVMDVTSFVTSNERLKSDMSRMEADILTRALELQKTNEKLRVAIEEQEKFFEVSLDMLCISSYDGHFRKVNPAFQQVLGYTPKEMCERPYLDFVHPDDIERTKAEVARQLETKEPVLSFENRYRHADGSYRLLSWKSAPVDNLMYAAARDVTDFRRSELELRTAKATIEHANEELEAFSYSVAHDLRAPLRAMLGFSEIIFEDHGADLAPEVRKNLFRVTDAAKKMAHLVDGLLMLAQISRKEFTKERVDLSALAHEIANDLRESNPERAVDFVIDPTLTALGEPALLRQLLTNLLGNAWKFTSKLPHPARIEFGVRESSDIREFFIRDNGVGFDPRFASKLFGVFQRLHLPSEFEGSGIGLATVLRIARRHGGYVRAESTPGAGATFYFSL